MPTDINLEELPGDALVDVLGVVGEAIAEKATASKATNNTFQEGKYTSDEMGALYMMLGSLSSDGIPAYGNPARDVYLSKIWREEPIMAGAVYAMTAMVGAWDYTLTGVEQWASYYLDMLNRADDGKGWQAFIERFVVDLLTVDRGGFVEVARSGDNADMRALDIYNMDALRSRPVNNSDYPVAWRRDDGKWIRIPAANVVHQVLLPSARDSDRNIGFSPVSRALKASQLLLLLHDHDAQKLSNLPPDGVAVVNGLSIEKLLRYMALYQARRQSRGQSVFPGVLWIAGGASAGMGNMPKVELDLTSFSEMPEQFDRLVMYEIYAKILALCFGVDVGEFWLIQHSGATKASQTIQHQKAKGKGPGDLASGIERWINWNVLGDSVEFVFDQRDDESDVTRMEVHKGIVEYIERLVNMGAIDSAEARLIAAQNEIIPGDMSDALDERVLDDTEKFVRRLAWERGEDIVRVNRKGHVTYRWRAARQFSVPWWAGKAAASEYPYVPAPGYGEVEMLARARRAKALAGSNGTKPTDTKSVAQAPGDEPASFDVPVPAGGVDEEVARLPAWRRGDLDSWDRELGGFLAKTQEAIDDRLAAWLDEPPIAVGDDLTI